MVKKFFRRKFFGIPFVPSVPSIFFLYNVGQIQVPIMDVSENAGTSEGEDIPKHISDIVSRASTFENNFEIGTDFRSPEVQNANMPIVQSSFETGDKGTSLVPRVTPSTSKNRQKELVGKAEYRGDVTGKSSEPQNVTTETLSTSSLTTGSFKIQQQDTSTDSPVSHSAFNPCEEVIKPPSVESNHRESRKTPEKERQRLVLESKFRPGTPSDKFKKNPSTNCPKHSSANNAGEKVAFPVAKPQLCDSCTSSMLSYISVLQDFLKTMAQDISDQDILSNQCIECVKERLLHRSMTSLGSRRKTYENESGGSSESKDTIRDSHLDMRNARQEPVKYIDHKQGPVEYHANNIRKPVEYRAKNTQGPVECHANNEQRSTEYHVDLKQGPIKYGAVHNQGPIEYQAENEHGVAEYHANGHYKEESDKENEAKPNVYLYSTSESHNVPIDVEISIDTNKVESHQSVQHSQTTDSTSWKELQEQQASTHRAEGEDQHFFSQQVNDDKRFHNLPEESPTASSQDQIHYYPESKTSVAEKPAFANTLPTPLRDWCDLPSSFVARNGRDDILSTLSNEEREVYDSARGRAGWDRLTEPHEDRDAPFTHPRAPNEAFVTMAGNNAEAISCLVLGCSLLLCRTSRALCVLITDGVSASLRAPLSSVFQVVLSVRSLDSHGTTKLSLLDQPELGIFFRKLHVWRLEQFSKCIFLNPDIVVVQNCDELFCNEELSAVPDIGWPDCFNSGMFVYKPSVSTFWKLVEFAENQGSYDGGDQGLLNGFFSSWSKDIHKKLSFIYNLMANVSYTYTPAFRRFGRNVKIVQFQGPYKPWHVKFYAETGQISESSMVHPTYVQFVHVWINIFRVRVLPLLSQEVQSFASSQRVISSYELLRFFPSETGVELDFLLTPPSVRTRHEPHNFIPISRSSESLGNETAQTRRKSLTLQKDSKMGSPDVIRKSHSEEDIRSKINDQLAVLKKDSLAEDSAPKELEQLSTDFQPEPSVSSSVDEKEAELLNLIPGSDLGDYQGMAAWEQGRMDYMGSANSDIILKRLLFLMEKSDRIV